MHTLFVVPVAVISIHALRGEGDRLRRGLIMRAEEFQSTPSVGRATKVFRLRRHDSDISIHALRGEGDAAHKTQHHTFFYFNPRPPWGGRRNARRLAVVRTQFQSTPSVGRATIDPEAKRLPYKISIHALRGEGDNCLI